MNEIEKMYKNAEIELIVRDNAIGRGYYIEHQRVEEYPPFTAEKQLELIKFLMEQEDFSWTIVRRGKNTEYTFYVGYEYSSGGFKEFTEALAGLINNLWQDLTEKERKQVKEILEWI